MTISLHCGKLAKTLLTLWCLSFALTDTVVAQDSDIDTQWFDTPAAVALPELGNWKTTSDGRSAYVAKFAADSADEIQCLWKQFHVRSELGVLQKTAIANGAFVSNRLKVERCANIPNNKDKYAAFNQNWTARLVVTSCIALAGQTNFALRLGKGEAVTIDGMKTTLHKEVLCIDVDWNKSLRELAIYATRASDYTQCPLNISSTYNVVGTSKNYLTSNKSTVSTSFASTGIWKEVDFGLNATTFEEKSKKRLRVTIDAIPCELQFGNISLVRPSTTKSLRSLALSIRTSLMTHVEAYVTETHAKIDKALCTLQKNQEIKAGYKHVTKNLDLSYDSSEEVRCVGSGSSVPVSARFAAIPSYNKNSKSYEGIDGAVLFVVERETVGTKQTCRSWTRFCTSNGINWTLKTILLGDAGGGIDVVVKALGPKLSNKYSLYVL